jgi:hypothetical protein
VSKFRLLSRELPLTVESIASCTLFGVLAVVDRPFEAHLFKHGYEQHAEPSATPGVSRRTSAARPVSYISEKRTSNQRRSVSAHRRNPSDYSFADVATIDLSNSPAPSTIFAPSPIRSLGLGIFTSHHMPPPIPAAYFDTRPPVFNPSTANRSLTRPPRLSGHLATSGFAPLVQYSASTWRAVHPTLPASRSQPYLPSIGLSHHSRYSRSSVSFTRPHRLSYAAPTASSSSRSGSTGPEGRDSPLSATGDAYEKATPSEIAYTILNGTPIPGTTRVKGRTHMRTASAPDATSGAQQAPHSERMAIGWKPQLPDLDLEQKEGLTGNEQQASEIQPVRLVKLTHSSSEGFLSRFSPDTSPDNDLKKSHQELERELAARLITRKPVPARSRSADPMRHSSVPTVAEAATVMISKMPQDLETPKARPVSTDDKPKTPFEEGKDKPLPGNRHQIAPN